jgi:trehalose 6-phosphate phosphatase
MTPILSRAGSELLAQLAAERALLAFDFDGTLAPLVADRQAAAMRDATRGLLRTLALLYPCAVISGRAREDVRGRLSGLPLVAVVGNHGAEAGHGPLPRGLLEHVARWSERLAGLLGGAEGVEIEDKGLSIALHYRRAARPREARGRIQAAAAGLEGAVALEGHDVVDLTLRGAPTKGDALRDLCRRLGIGQALYVGDDATDEDAFRSQVVRVGVRVGTDPRTAARYFLADQPEVDELLRALIVARLRVDGYTGSNEGVLRAGKG